MFLAWLGAAFLVAGGTSAAVSGLTLVIAVFACVVAHEFGHITMARRFGYDSPEVTLLPIGGVARFRTMPERPGEELAVALAGPAVNVVIALVLIVLLGARLDPTDLDLLQDPGTNMIGRVAVANVALGVFNLIPAFPMDGGRVLRALLAMRMGNARATEVAATIGQGFAVVFGVLGIFYNPMLIIIAVFIFLAASGEAAQAQLRAVAQGALVSDAMITEFQSLGTGATVNDAVEALIRTTQTEFPIVDGGGRLRGVLTRDAMVKALKERGADTPVLEVMQAVQTVTDVGYEVERNSGQWVFSGEKERKKELWQRVNRIDVAMMIIETAFSDRERELAQRSLHLAPSSLADELDQIDRSRRFPIYITHTKPAETGLIMEEIRRFDDAPNRPNDVRHDIRWLSAGQTFEL